MSLYIDKLRDFLMSNGVANPYNPTKNQTMVEALESGSEFFLDSCKPCRAYCSLQKTDWAVNNTLRAML